MKEGPRILEKNSSAALPDIVRAMKILIKQFLGKNHSWSVCGWGMAQALLRLGHDVDLFSTDGIKHLPESLKPYLIGYVEENIIEKVYGRGPGHDYDCQISYTAMKNFPFLLSHGLKNRFGIWCYEWAGANVLPTGFAKNYQACDLIITPSHFAKKVFVDSGVPENRVRVVPHGITASLYRASSTVKLPTQKSYKILANVAQNHRRKNIPGLLEAYGKAFTNKDDVCLILKTKDKKPTHQFDISLQDCLADFKKRFPQHAELKVMSDFVEDISSLYRSVDTIFTMSHCEGFYFPGLEGIAAGKMSIAPNWGGQVDFLNNSNALLIDGKEGRADPKSMYWESKNNAIWFVPSVDDAAAKLRYAYQNYQSLNAKTAEQQASVLNQYGWSNVVDRILSCCA